MPELHFARLNSLGLAILLLVLGCGEGEHGSHSGRAGVLPEQSLSNVAFDLEDKQVDPFRDPNATAFVFAFVSTECPISNRYAPELQRLQEHFSSRGAAFWLVYPNTAESREQISTHVKEFRYGFAALRDPDHFLVRKAAVRVTPEVAVFTKIGQLAYHGRIDDRYAELNKERSQPTTHELADALEAVLSGLQPAITNVSAIGCPIQRSR